MSRPYRYRDLFARSRRLWLVRREPLAYAWSEESERRERLARSAVGRVLHVLYRVLHPRSVLALFLGNHPHMRRVWSLIIVGRLIIVGVRSTWPGALRLARRR
jgi:hypothetical protein